MQLPNKVSQSMVFIYLTLFVSIFLTYYCGKDNNYNGYDLLVCSFFSPPHFDKGDFGGVERS